MAINQRLKLDIPGRKEIEKGLNHDDPEIIKLSDELDTYQDQSTVMEVDRAVGTGKRLKTIKLKLKRSEWLPWVRTREKFSDRSAQIYIKLERYSVTQTARFKQLKSMGTYKLAYLMSLPPNILNQILRRKTHKPYPNEPAIPLTELTYNELKMVAEALMGLPDFIPQKEISGVKARVSGLERSIQKIIKNRRQIPEEIRMEIGRRIRDMGEELMAA